MTEDQESFFCDVMLGRLAKWLRILGYSCLYQSFGGLQKKLLICTRKRITFLTRNSQCPSVTTQAKVIFIESEKPRQQIWQLLDDRLIEINEANLFRRCTMCNHPLEIVDKEEIAGQVPPYALETSPLITRCPQCQKYYWRGTHHERFLNSIIRR